MRESFGGPSPSERRIGNNLRKQESLREANSRTVKAVTDLLEKAGLGAEEIDKIVKGVEPLTEGLLEVQFKDGDGKWYAVNSLDVRKGVFFLAHKRDHYGVHSIGDMRLAAK